MTGAQKKKIRRIMIAAPKSGSGKTTITCGLLQIFKENGEDISSCKCGPDYIDPMFHRQVLGGALSESGYLFYRRRGHP